MKVEVDVDVDVDVKSRKTLCISVHEYKANTKRTINIDISPSSLSA